MYKTISGRRVAASILAPSQYGSACRCTSAPLCARTAVRSPPQFRRLASAYNRAVRRNDFLGQELQHRFQRLSRGFAVSQQSEGGTDSPAREAQVQGKGIGGAWQEALPPPFDSIQPGQALTRTVTTWQQRTAAYARSSFLSAYAAFIDNTLVALLQLLRADELFRRLTPWLEDSLAWLSRTWHVMADGRRVSYSLVNNTAPDFSIPGQYSAASVLPGLAGGQRQQEAAWSDDYDPAASHFLSLCMKVVYEKEEVLQDIVKARWGLRFYGYFSTGSEAFVTEDGAAFVPRTRAALLGSDAALVLAFRGSEPTNLINLRSAGRISMTERAGLPGRVHDGFYSALFHGDEEAGVLFSQLVSAIQAAEGGQPKTLHVTGHSLGAALAVVFAQVLLVRHPGMAARIAGVYAFAAPRVGDAAFAAGVEAAYRGRVFRVAYGADIIPYLPPKFLEYADAGEEVFITSFGRVLRDPEEVRRWHRIEGWGFLPLYLYKLVGGALNPAEGAMRTLYRAGLLVTFPGLNDHLPAEYEGRLRRALPAAAPAAGDGGKPP